MSLLSLPHTGHAIQMDEDAAARRRVVGKVSFSGALSFVFLIASPLAREIQSLLWKERESERRRPTLPSPFPTATSPSLSLSFVRVYREQTEE